MPKELRGQALPAADHARLRDTPKGTRLHLRRAQIAVRLGQALAGGAHPRRIKLFESLSTKN